MNYSRVRVAVVALVAVVSLLSIAAPAGADVAPTLGVSLSDNHLGAHADTTVQLDFDYGDGGLIDPTLYPLPNDWRESVKSVVVDIPNGLVGNPNAIPYDERCDPAVFDAGTLCPASSTIGTFAIKTTLLPNDTDPPPAPGDGYIQVKIPGPGGGVTRMSLLKTSRTRSRRPSTTSRRSDSAS